MYRTIAVQGYGVDNDVMFQFPDVLLYDNCANPSVSRWYRIRTSSPQVTAAIPGAAAEAMVVGFEKALVDSFHTASLTWLPWMKQTLMVRCGDEFTIDVRYMLSGMESM